MAAGLNIQKCHLCAIGCHGFSEKSPGEAQNRWNLWQFLPAKYGYFMGISLGFWSILVWWLSQPDVQLRWFPLKRQKSILVWEDWKRVVSSKSPGPFFSNFWKIDWQSSKLCWLGMVQYLLSTKKSSMMESYPKNLLSFVDYWYLSARRQMDVQRDRSGLCTPRASPAKMAWVAGPFVWVRALRSETTWNLGRLWFWYKLNSGWIWVIW